MAAPSPISAAPAGSSSPDTRGVTPKSPETGTDPSGDSWITPRKLGALLASVACDAGQLAEAASYLTEARSSRPDYRRVARDGAIGRQAASSAEVRRAASSALADSLECTLAAPRPLPSRNRYRDPEWIDAEAWCFEGPIQPVAPSDREAREVKAGAQAARQRAAWRGEGNAQAPTTFNPAPDTDSLRREAGTALRTHSVDTRIRDGEADRHERLIAPITRATGPAHCFGSWYEKRLAEDNPVLVAESVCTRHPSAVSTLSDAGLIRKAGAEGDSAVVCRRGKLSISPKGKVNRRRR